MTTTDDRLESLANELRDVRERLGVLKTAEADLVGRIRDEVGEHRGPVSAHGKVLFTVMNGKRFNPELARRVIETNLGTDILLSCSEMVVVADKAKRILAPAIYELCQAPNAVPTITLKSAS